MWYFWCLLICFVDALRVLSLPCDVVLTSVRFETYGFQLGGSALIKGQSETRLDPKKELSYGNRSVFIFFCGIQEYQSRTRSNSWSQICYPQKNAHIVPLDGEFHYITFKDSIVAPELYYFAVVDCSFGSISSNLTLRLSYHFLSDPSGNELPAEDHYEPYTESARFISLFVCTFVWLIAMMCNKEFLTPFHYNLIAVLLLKVFSSALDGSYWYLYWYYGTRNSYFANFSRILFALSEFGIELYNVFFFKTVILISVGLLLMMFMLARGFRITRSSLLLRYFKLYTFFCLIFFGALCAFSFLNSDFYWLTFLVIYFFALPNIYSSISLILRFLANNITYLERHPNGNVIAGHLQTYFLEQIQNKFALLTRVRFIVIGYFSIIIFSNCLLTIITPWYYNWLESSLNCFVSVAVLVILCGILYPRKNVFFCNAEDFQKFAQIQSLVDQHIDGGGNNDGVEQLNEVPWDLSKVVFVVWPSLADMKKSEQIVVKNTLDGDSEEDNSIENEKNETPNSSPFSLSVGYEEVFYINEATKLNEKLL